MNEKEFPTLKVLIDNYLDDNLLCRQPVTVAFEISAHITYPIKTQEAIKPLSQLYQKFC